MALDIDVLTLFPEMFAGPLSHSIIGRARNQGIVQISLWNIRDFTLDKHRIVDDTPYGGGPGMVMKPDVLARALDFIRLDNSGPVIYLTPQGQTLAQSAASKLAAKSQLILLCGHYEGIDERFRALYVDIEMSIGDYVLTGGELPAMVLIDTVARLLTGVLGAEDSATEDSFSNGLLEHPHYTRPRVFREMEVPSVLLSGHHGQIQRWRLKESLRRTLERRPDLLDSQPLSKDVHELLEDVKQEDCKERTKGGLVEQ